MHVIRSIFGDSFMSPDGHNPVSCLCWWGWTGNNGHYINGGPLYNRLVADYCTLKCHYTHVYRNSTCAHAQCHIGNTRWDTLCYKDGKLLKPSDGRAPPPRKKKRRENMYRKRSRRKHRNHQRKLFRRKISGKVEVITPRIVFGESYSVNSKLSSSFNPRYGKRHQNNKAYMGPTPSLSNIRTVLYCHYSSPVLSLVFEERPQLKEFSTNLGTSVIPLETTELVVESTVIKKMQEYFTNQTFSEGMVTSMKSPGSQTYLILGDTSRSSRLQTEYNHGVILSSISSPAIDEYNMGKKLGISSSYYIHPSISQMTDSDHTTTLTVERVDKKNTTMTNLVHNTNVPFTHVHPTEHLKTALKPTKGKRDQNEFSSKKEHSSKIVGKYGRKHEDMVDEDLIIDK